MFPPEYPFAPPAIRMHTPSGRFQPSSRLCLSISDFHPKSFNPAWEVSTILIGLLSFMTSDEMTTGSISATEAERKHAARQTRWWNSTGGGSEGKLAAGVNASTKGIGAIKSGDGGVKFKAEWPELDEENRKWMTENNIDFRTGKPPASCNPEASALKKRPSVSGAGLGEVQAARNAGQSWLRRNKWMLGGMLVFGYVLLARLLGDQDSL